MASLTPPTSPIAEDNMSSAPKIRFCVKRKDEHYVPLIAIDELPSWIKLKGVPNNVRSTDALDLGWVNCGYHPRTNDEYHEVQFDEMPAEMQPSGVGKEREADESSASQISFTEDKSVLKAPDKNGEGSKTSSDFMGKGKSRSKTTQAHPRVPPIKQATPGTLGRKVYCTYWLQKGNCNYAQEGCKFLHEIPPDDETREKIGFRDHPKWWLVTPPQPTPAKDFQKDKTHRATWRGGLPQEHQRKLPASLSHGQYRAPPSIAARVPDPDLVHRRGVIPAPIMAPTSTDDRASEARALDLHKLQAAQQAALFLPHQHYGQDLRQVQLNSFDGANGNSTFQPITPTHQRTFPSQPPQKAFSVPSSVSTTSHSRTPAIRGTNQAGPDTGAAKSLSDLLSDSVPSPPVMHRRLFVKTGEPTYSSNPVEPEASKAGQRSHSNRRAGGRGRGSGAGKAGQAPKGPKAQVQAAQEEDLVLL